MTAEGQTLLQPDRGPGAGRRVARNTGLRAVTEVLGKLASVVLFALIARRLGDSTLGNFVFALAVSQILWAVSNFGLDRYLLREIAREPQALHRLFFNAMALKLAVGVPASVIATAAVAALGFSTTVQALTLILCMATVLTLLGTTAVMVFQAYEHMEYFLYSQIPTKYLNAGFGILVILLGGGIIGVAIVTAVAALAGLVMSLVMLHRYVGAPAREVQPRGWPGLYRDAAPFGLQETLGQLIYRVDTVLLSLYASAAVVGWYGASYRLLEATLFLAWSVAGSATPMFTYLTERTAPRLSVAFEKSLKFVAVLMVPAAVTFTVCAEPLINLVYGIDQFGPAVGSLRWLAWASLAYGIGHVSGALVLIHRRGRVTVFATAAVAAQNLVLCLVLIPAFSLDGAAAATLVSEVTLCLLSVILAVPVVGRLRLHVVLGGPLVAGAVMAAVMYFVRDSLVLALPLGTLAYLAALALFEARTYGEDLTFVRGLLKRGPQPSAIEDPL